MSIPESKKYKVFISYTKEDYLIARELRNFLAEAFQGEIESFHAGDDLESGQNWKEEIKKNLSKANAIISVMTQTSKNKPWLMVEWGSFWLAEKDMHVLVFDGVKESDLIQPMLDYQYINPKNKDSLKRFIKRLSNAAAYSPVPYGMTEDLMLSINIALQEQKHEAEKNSFAKYENKFEELPIEDELKRKVAEYFFDSNNLEVFDRVFGKIKDDSKKHYLVTKMIQNKKFGLAVKYASEIMNPEAKRDIVIDLLDEDFDQSIVYPLVQNVAQINQPQMRIILARLIDLNRESSAQFSKFLSLVTNTPTLHRIATHLRMNDKFESEEFMRISEMICLTNAAEARKLGDELIDSGLEDSDQFKKIVTLMGQKNQIETVKLLLNLKASNKDLFEEFKNSGIITSDSATRRLNGFE